MEGTMLFNGGFTFTNFATDLFAIFLFFLWFWLLITVASDLLRRHDISGLGKILWVILPNPEISWRRSRSLATVMRSQNQRKNRKIANKSVAKLVNVKPP